MLTDDDMCMPRLCAFIAVFVLLSVWATERTSAALLDSSIKEPATEHSAVAGHQSGRIFSTDVDLFLGQKRRQRTSGGRIWSNLYYGDTTLKPKESGKITPNFFGLQLGLDLTKPTGYSTFFFNINQSEVKFAPGMTSTIDNYLVGYGKFMQWGLCLFTFAGSIAYDQYEISANGNHTGDGLQTSFFGEFGLDFKLGKWGFKPFYALQYDFLYHGNIGKSPMRDWNAHGLNQLAGLRVSWKVFSMLELQSRAVWVHEMLDDPPPFYRMRFSPVHGTSTPAILYYEGNTGRDWAWLGIGARVEVLNLHFFGDYDVLLNARHVTHLASLGLCLGW